MDISGRTCRVFLTDHSLNLIRTQYEANPDYGTFHEINMSKVTRDKD